MTRDMWVDMMSLEICCSDIPNCKKKTYSISLSFGTLSLFALYEKNFQQWNRDRPMVSKIGIRNSGHWLSKSVKKFHVIGSDDCKNWLTLLRVDDAGFTEQLQLKSWRIPAEKRQRFTCLGIKIASNAGGNAIVSLSQILMWTSGHSENMLKMMEMHGVTIF